MKKDEELNNKVCELTDKSLEKTGGGSYEDGGCDRYDDKPGTHQIDDYGHCFACLHNLGDRCEFEQ